MENKKSYLEEIKEEARLIAKRKGKEPKKEKVSEPKPKVKTQRNVNPFSTSLKSSLDSKHYKPKISKAKEIFGDTLIQTEQKKLGYSNENKEKEIAKKQEIYKQLGLSNNDLNDAYEQRDELITYNKYKSKFGELIYHLNDLKKLSLNYRLQLGKTRFYAKKISIKAAGEVSDFCEKYDIDITGAAKERFYILAPREDFNPNNSNSKRDPFIVYRIKDSSYFVPVSDPKESYSIFRFILGNFMKSKNNLIISIILFSILFGSNLAMIFFGYGYEIGILSFVMGIIGALISFNSPSWYRKVSENDWYKDEY